MKLTTRLFRNTAANYLGTFSAFLVGLFLTPYVINTLGDTRYGIWTLVGSVTGYLALLDLGLGNALTKYTAQYAARQDTETVDEMTSTLFFAFSALGVAAFAALVWLSFSFARLFDVPAEFAQAARVSLVVLGLNFAVSMPLNVYRALISGHQRYDILNVVTTLGWLLTAGLTVLVLARGRDLVALAVVTLTVTILKGWLSHLALRRWVAPVRIRPSLVTRSVVGLLLSYSLLTFVMVGCRQIESSTGPVIVGKLVGLDAVTAYSVGDKVGNLVRQFAFPVAWVLFPAFSALDALADRRRLSLLLIQGLRGSALVGMPIAGVAIVLIRPTISLWIGPEYVASSMIGIVLVLKTLVDQQLLAASSLLAGLGRLKLYTALHVFGVLFSIGFSLAFAPRWGVVAVALGSLLAWTVVLVVTVPYAARVAGVGLGRLVGGALVRPVTATLITCIALFGLVRWHAPASWLQLLLYGAAAAAIYLGLAWLYCLKGEERASVVRFGRQLLVKAGLLPANEREL